MIVVLGALSAFGPMSIDMYLPAFPALARHFAAGEAQVQLTLTACLAGLALGQLLYGPLSDARGRRRPLYAGLVAYVVASGLCAVAPSVAVLTGLRFVQGLGGAAGIVIARAVVRDLYSGVAAARFFSLLMLVNGLAPMLAPLAGGLVFAAMFAYISGSSFVTQEIYGVSPQTFGIIFGVNALGIMLASQVNGALLGRFSPGALLSAALALHLAAGLGVLAGVLSGSRQILWLLPPLFLAVSMVGVVLPNTTALALSGHPSIAGTASALLGLGQYVFGAAVAPLVGLGGHGTALPMAVVIAGLGLAANLVLHLVARVPDHEKVPA